MTMPEEIVVEKPWLKVGCNLGEGPIYDPITSTLHFVDIGAKRVYHVDIGSLEVKFEQFEEPVTCLSLCEQSSRLAGVAAQGFAFLPGDSKLEYISKPLSTREAPYTRFNDGACDSKSRFFAGTLYSPVHNIPGRLYRYDPTDKTCVVVDPGPFTDSNGLGWSPDEKTFYLTDSFRNVIYAYDYDDGKLANRRVFVDAIALGLPDNTFCDGLCIDVDGYLWSCRWGGSQAVRFSKEGAIDLVIRFPTAYSITACCFGGPNNDQLFVTTAHCGANGVQGGSKVVLDIGSPVKYSGDSCDPSDFFAISMSSGGRVTNSVILTPHGSVSLSTVRKKSIDYGLPRLQGRS